ncbi:MAG: diacylglycerol kinase, partial [Betaproteobacteria bacterium]
MQEPVSHQLGLDPANESPFKGKTGLRRVWNALHYSLAGLRAAYLCEDAFRQEIWLAALLIPLALWLPVSWMGSGLMVASVLFVLVVELLNSAIEAVVDRVSLENHRLAKRAK